MDRAEDRTVLMFTAEPERAMDSLVAPRGKRVFTERADINIRPHTVMVLGRTPKTLRATEVFVRGFTEEERRSVPVVDGKVSWPYEPISPATPLLVTVENMTDEPQEARVVVIANGQLDLDKPSVDSHVMRLQPVTEPPRRICIKPHIEYHGWVRPVALCRPRKILMRSDAPLDLEVTNLQVGNITLMCGTVPVATFEALDVHAPALHPTTRLSVSVKNTTDEEHWVTIEVEMERL